jgi:hypothetical protein
LTGWTPPPYGPRMRTALIGLALLWSSLARAAIIIVPDQYPTIQAAVEAATSFDMIQVRPATYAEALVLGNKTVVIGERKRHPELFDPVAARATVT